MCEVPPNHLANVTFPKKLEFVSLFTLPKGAQRLNCINRFRVMHLALICVEGSYWKHRITLFSKLFCYRITRIRLDSSMLVESGHVGTSVNHRHDQRPKFSSESTIISPFVHFQMPPTFSCGPNNTEQENLRLFGLCVPGMCRGSGLNYLSCGFDAKTIKRPLSNEHLSMATRFAKKQLEVTVNVPSEDLRDFEHCILN